MKHAQILLLVLVLASVISCSKKSDPQPVSSLSSASLSLASSTPPVTAPAGLSTSQNSYAQETDFYIESVNAISSSFAAAFAPPAGATKSSTQIVGVNENGRVASTQQDYLVYMWTDSQVGSVAYQISETSDSYTFELFYKATGTNSWVRVLEASEKKDKSSGFMNVYDQTVTTKGSPATAEYQWTRGTNTFNFVVDDMQGETFTLNYNTQTKVGDIEDTENSLLAEKLTWDGQGHGTWAEYDTDGVTVDDSGTW